MCRVGAWVLCDFGWVTTLSGLLCSLAPALLTGCLLAPWSNAHLETSRVCEGEEIQGSFLDKAVWLS